MHSNENFNRILEESGKSKYALSMSSGVPFTTISEIHRGQNDINQCAAGTVKRIAAALGVAPDDIMNDIHYLDGVRGKYDGISYVWSTGKYSQITFCYEGKEVTLSAGKLYNIPSRVAYYNVVAGWMIKEYISGLKWKESIRGRVERIRNDE